MEHAVQVNGMWFQVVEGKGTISMISRRHGRYTGTVVNTTGGKQVLFSHNGHRYMGSDIKATFERMVQREVR